MPKHASPTAVGRAAAPKAVRRKTSSGGPGLGAVGRTVAGVRRACTCVSVGLGLAVISAGARADGLAVVGGSPRAIGRAGAATASDDGGGALLVNPAGLARREPWRVQLGLAFVDDALTFRRGSSVPIARDQAGSSMLPSIAIVGALGAWELGFGAMTTSVSEHAFRDPADVPQATDLGAAFDYRYHGISGAVRRDTLTFGVARRIGETLAVGVAFGASRVTVQESRRMWAGFAGITPVGDPRRDVQLAFDATDELVPSAVAGVLVAPSDGDLELAASVGWSARAGLDGEVAAVGTSGGPMVRSGDGHAAMALRQPVTARVGARYLGERFVIEAGGDLWVSRRGSGAASWAVDGVEIIDPSKVVVDLVGVPSRLSQRTHGSLRLAGDLEVYPGFLWVTAGYAYATGSTTEGRLSTSFGDLGGHTLALGVEGTAGGITYTLGWSRTWASVRGGGEALSLDNPFGAGDAALAPSSFDETSDQLGIQLDIELWAP